jgi:hypothetical protein
MRAVIGHLFRGFLVLLTIAGAVGCDHSNGGSGSTPSPVVSSLSIVGNPALSRPGETVQLSATAVVADGKTKDVTADASWSGTPGVLTVSKGMVAAVAFGKGQVTAVYGGQQHSVNLDVRPTGAFLVTGQVTEGGFALAQATVEATSAAGLHRATTDASGRFVLPGAGTVTFRAGKDGYEDVVTEVTVDRDSQVTLEIQRLNGSIDVRGTYQVAFIASPSCSLPAAMAKRVYTARIETSPTSTRPTGFVVLLSGADFWVDSTAGFVGWLAGDKLYFDLEDWNYEITERVGTDQAIGYSGRASGEAKGSGFVASFSGTVGTYSYPQYRKLTACTASDHRLEFTR